MPDDRSRSVTDQGLWRAVISLYKNSTPLFRAKSWIRWHHGRPFQRLECRVPRDGKIVDIGSGSGLFANLLKVAAPERDVLGIDVDPRQIQQAQRSIGPRAGITFEVRDLSQNDLPRCNAIVIVDVLHHMHFSEQDQLLRRCRTALHPEGVLIVSDVDLTPRWKYWYNWLCDSLTGLLQLTHASSLCYQNPTQMVARLKLAGFDIVNWEPFSHRELAARVLYIAKGTAQHESRS